MPDATQEGASTQDRLMAYLAPEPEAEAPETEEAEAVAEAPVEEADEAEAAEEGEPEESEDDAQEEDGEERIGLDDLAEYLKLDADKLDVDDDGSIYVKTKVDGEEGRATLAELIKSYQLEGHLNKQNMEVAEAKKSLQAKIAEAEQQAQARIQHLDTLAQVAVQQFQQDYQQVDWNGLRSEDPAEYAAKQAEFQQRQAQLQHLYQQVEQQRQGTQQQTQAQMQERLAEERQALARVLPEWSDPAVAAKEQQAIRDWGTQAGFSKEELGQVVDHRHVVLLRKAMLYDQLQSSKPEVTKKVRRAPKLTKPGQTQQKDSAAASRQKLKAAVRKSGGKQGVAQYLLAAGKV